MPWAWYGILDASRRVQSTPSFTSKTQLLSAELSKQAAYLIIIFPNNAIFRSTHVPWCLGFRNKSVKPIHSAIKRWYSYPLHLSIQTLLVCNTSWWFSGTAVWKMFCPLSYLLSLGSHRKIQFYKETYFEIRRRCKHETGGDLSF